jgi:hypothetical protein
MLLAAGVSATRTACAKAGFASPIEISNAAAET